MAFCAATLKWTPLQLLAAGDPGCFVAGAEPGVLHEAPALVPEGRPRKINREGALPRPLGVKLHYDRGRSSGWGADPESMR